MKVAILTYFWKSNRGGGITTYLNGYVETLKKMSDFQIKIGYVDGNDKSNYKIPKGIIRSFFGTISILKKIKPNTIHVHENWPLLFGGAVYKYFNKNINLIYTPLTEPIKRKSFIKKLKIIIRKFPSQWALDQCNYIVVGGKDYQKKVESIFKLKFKRNLKIIYPGVSQRKVTKTEIEDFYRKFGVGEKSIIILVQAFTATEEKAKGSILSIKALKKLKKEFPNIVLIITRKGKFSNIIKKFAEKEKISENVILTGDVENPFVPLKICDIFLWPWLGESGFGIALLEAMLMGKPIIATSNTGVLNPIKNNKHGLIIKPDEKSICRAVIDLYKNKKLSQFIAKNVQEFAKEQFTWEKCIKKYLELYKE